MFWRAPVEEGGCLAECRAVKGLSIKIRIFKLMFENIFAFFSSRNLVI